ncbi:MAG: FKBP-type peptidyl-prolyl cis-trans isomerase, partial [Flavobacteriaceae bacterium]|nr:FKBP-type peptidyl-prolyl cis-trans isomerase [Flavobacteriaceae bacterium]
KKKQEEKKAAKLKETEEEFGEVKKGGETFLEANKTKEGVQVTESGLQYIVLKEGTGEQPTKASRVKVHYHGTLIDGTVFDSSVDRGEPTEFGVSQVIKGWTEGLQLMKVGAKYKFFIPQELAYGARPAGKIKPYSALIFEVELLEIK